MTTWGNENDESVRVDEEMVSLADAVTEVIEPTDDRYSAMLGQIKKTHETHGKPAIHHLRLEDLVPRMEDRQDEFYATHGRVYYDTDELPATEEMN